MLANVVRFTSWAPPLLVATAMVLGPVALQVLAAGYLIHFVFLRMAKLLDASVPGGSERGVFQNRMKQTLKLAAWISVVGLVWLAITVSTNLMWPMAASPDSHFSVGK